MASAAILTAAVGAGGISRAESGQPAAAFETNLARFQQEAARQSAIQKAAVSAPQGPQVGFAPNSSIELKNSDNQVWVRTEKGTVNGLPASRVHTIFDHTVIVVARAAQVHGWNEARAACRGLAPAGAWDLPLDDDYMLLLWSEAVQIRIDLKRRSFISSDDKAGIYPMWLRVKDESENAAVFAGKSEVLAMSDGHGTDLDAMDVGPKAVAELRKNMAEIEEILRKGLYRSEAEEKRINAAIEDYNRRNRTRTIFNLDTPHPGELPADVNAILEKPSKARVMENRAILQKLIAAFENGYPAYCVAR